MIVLVSSPVSGAQLENMTDHFQTAYIFRRSSKMSLLVFGRLVWQDRGTGVALLHVYSFCDS